MAKKQSSVITTFIVGVAFIIGGWLGYTHFSVPMVEEAKTSESWPSAPGVITISEVDKSIDDGKTMYAAEIGYQFTVDNKSYIGNRISLMSGGTRTSSIRSVKKELGKYPIGKKVTIYYDPTFPDNAVLETGADTATIIFKYVPFVFIFVGALMVFQLIKIAGILVLALFLGNRK